MGTLQRVIKLNLLSSNNPGLVDGVSFIPFIESKVDVIFLKDYVWYRHW